MKKQIWFRPDQAALVVLCLKYVKGELVAHKHLLNGAQLMSCKYTHDQIEEVLKLFGEQPEQPETLA